jgi:hypothetical protein
MGPNLFNASYPTHGVVGIGSGVKQGTRAGLEGL